MRMTDRRIDVLDGDPAGPAAARLGDRATSDAARAGLESRRPRSTGRTEVATTTLRKVPIADEHVEPRACTRDARLRLLGQVAVFAALTPDEVARVGDAFSERRFHAGQTIYPAGAAARYLYVVAVGKVKLVRSTAGGQQVVLDVLGPGESFGSLSALGDRTYPDSAEAQTTCCVLGVSAEAFQAIMRGYPPVALAALEIVGERLRAAHDRIEQLTGETVEQRVAATLLTLADRVGEPRGAMLLIQMPLSRQDLADMAGTTRETASRVLSQLDRAGVIRSGRGWVGLTDRDRLAAIAAGERA